MLRSDGLVWRSGALVLRSGAPLRFNYTVCGAQAQLNACLPLPKNLYYNSVSIKVGLGRTIDDDTTQIITTVESHSVQWYKISLVSSAKNVRIFFAECRRIVTV